MEALKTQIEERRKELSKAFTWPTSKRTSEAYKDELVRQADEKVKLPAVPSHENMELYKIPANAREVWLRDVARAHPLAL